MQVIYVKYVQNVNVCCARRVKVSGKDRHWSRGSEHGGGGESRAGVTYTGNTRRPPGATLAVCAEFPASADLSYTRSFPPPCPSTSSILSTFPISPPFLPSHFLIHYFPFFHYSLSSPPSCFLPHPFPCLLFSFLPSFHMFLPIIPFSGPPSLSPRLSLCCPIIPRHSLHPLTHSP